jgi:hypothetical protein
MDLRKQYKRLFEGRVSSNDARLLTEGTWELGTPIQMKKGIKDLEKLSSERDIKLLARELNKLERELYGVFGDDMFFDFWSDANKAVKNNDVDGVMNSLGDLIGRAEELLADNNR